jgi:hypothetical protein
MQVSPHEGPLDQTTPTTSTHSASERAAKVVGDPDIGSGWQCRRFPLAHHRILSLWVVSELASASQFGRCALIGLGQPAGVDSNGRRASTQCHDDQQRYGCRLAR